MTFAIDDFAPSPLAFLRTPLFSAAERSKKMLENVQLAGHKNSPMQVCYSGPQLNQQHAVVWQALVREHRRQRAHVTKFPVSIRKADLLRATGHGDDMSTSTRERIWTKLEDMQQAIVKVETDRHRYSGQLVGSILLSKETKMFQIFLDDKLVLMLQNEVANIDLDRKLTYGRHQLACWLHDFISTQSNTKRLPWPVPNLREWSGSPLALPQFRQKLKEAIELLKGGPNPLLIAARITADVFVYEKTGTSVWFLPPDFELKTKAKRSIATEADEARARRGRVAL